MSQAKADETKKQKPKGENNSKNNNKKEEEEAPVWTPELQANLERILEVGEECISEPELRNLLLRTSLTETKRFNLYDGFEPSGRMHIAQGIFKAMNVNRCTSSGGTFVFWVADWFALMNDKLGGDLEKIQVVGQYLIEVWRAAGMDLTDDDRVVFKWASREITERAHIYWPKMLDVARRFNVTRIKKCCQIMGRMEGNLKASQALYPLMQCTDVFFLEADVCQLGVDQRKVNMLAREYCDAVKKKSKPVILSHHMLFGLKAGQEKMSKSDPDSAVFMEDSEEDVRRKILAAYCPRTAEDVTTTTTTTTTTVADAGAESMHLDDGDDNKFKNPCLDYVKHIVFAPPGATFSTEDATYQTYREVEDAFVSGALSELSLKMALVNELNRLLEPVRTHFRDDPNARSLLEQVRGFKKMSTATTTERKVLRRLDLVGTSTVPAGSHLVFVPPPTTQPTLQSAMDVLAQIENAVTSPPSSSQQQQQQRPVVLYFSDWGFTVENRLLADPKAIRAYEDVFLTSLKALATDPELFATRVTVVRQSDAILLDPSNYWISVINVGRFFTLAEIMGSNVNDSDGVGIVISRLMRVADVLAVLPASFSYSSTSVDAGIEADLVDKYLAMLDDETVQPPTLMPTTAPTLLLYRREEAHRTPNDEYYVTDDPKVNGKSKMKKAFCEPGNVEFCPPVTLAWTFGAMTSSSSSSSITIARSEENGGNLSFSSLEEFTEAFASQQLHPGDVKATCAQIMVDVLQRLQTAIKADSAASKAVKALKACEKKMSKQKK